MGYIIKIIISGELSVSDVGILYGIISLVTLLASYNDLWVTESLKHFIPQFVTEKRYDKVKSILFYALIMQVITSLFIAGLFFFWAEYIAQNYFKSAEAKEVLKVFAFFFIGINIFQTLSTFFMAVQDTFYSKIVDLVRMLFIVISVAFVFFTDISSSLLNYSYSWIIWLYIWVVISLCVFYKKYYRNYLSSEHIFSEKKFIKQIFSYAGFVFIWASAGTILWQIDMQMVIYLLGTTEAWYYTNYLSIITIPFMLIGPVFVFLFPVFSELYAKSDYKKIRILKQVFQSNFLLIAISCNLFLFVFAELIAYILFGEKFIQSWNILRYSVLLLVFNFFLQINFNLMAGIGKIKERVKIIFIAVAYNCIMNILLIQYIGVSGAALATWTWWILIWLLSEYFLGKKYTTSFEITSTCKNLLCIWGVALVSYHVILPYLVDMGRLKTLWILSIIMCIWFCVFWVINYSRFKIFISEIRKLKH